MAARKKSAPKAEVTTTTAVVDGGSGDEVGRWSAERFTVDPVLLEVAKAESEGNLAQPEPRQEPTIDERLLKVRDADRKKLGL